ncbi:hypothetical protein GPECTOR_1290g538 [Gonium pectorale]|uniref:Uncharacterized protein n=1 Tax=Gonium pectorale TaxID=33097 RepID=A0A150FUS0_GONPE|nr:hypothetical protein GPECTOR_1290g538 [Gonium pectorale]|eukprot:KXZ40925.1 hypothetical protein GPECTOR_1290g538 [Gonium pectorale]
MELGVGGPAAAAAEAADADAGLGSTEAHADEAPPLYLPFDDADDDIPLAQLLAGVQRLQAEFEQQSPAEVAAAAVEEDEPCADLLFEPSPAKKPRTDCVGKRQPAKQRTPKTAKLAPPSRQRVRAALCDSDGAASESEAELSDDVSDNSEGSGDEEDVLALRRETIAANRARRVSKQPDRFGAA